MVSATGSVQHTRVEERALMKHLEQVLGRLHALLCQKAIFGHLACILGRFEPVGTEAGHFDGQESEHQRSGRSALRRAMSLPSANSRV